ncbi:hypothetical protein BGZ73_003587 [Actinomortierella ambigua]|nr:hypothetical protein BGZ73_003587 [Actinomortierella ambigua]
MSLQLGKCVGQGGFGAVYIGMWHGQRCAVKRFYLLGQDNLIQKEIELVRHLHHRHIIQFLATERYEGSLVMITDFAEGGTLQSAIQDKRLGDGWTKKDEIYKEIAKGLAYLHSNKILHRDLKSGNVLLTKYLEVKLCDFGLAQVKISTASSINGTQQSVEGTLRWMAPEALALRPKYSTKSDMYSLGMVMWEMASDCTTPFREQRDNFVVVGYIRQGEREEIPDETPAEYRTWIERCWEQDPNKRPEASEMFNESIDDVGYASGNQVSVVSVSTDIWNPIGMVGKQRTGISIDASKLSKRPGLAAKLESLKGEYAERVRDMLSILDENGDVPDSVVEELELMVTPINHVDVEAGVADAQYKLGRKLLQALGVEPNYKEGLRLLEQAADQGHRKAQFYALQMCAFTGQKQPFSTYKMDEWLNMEVVRGNALAKTLRFCAELVPEELVNNLHLMEILQEREAKGDGMASLVLGFLHVDIPSVQDCSKARHYLERAVKRGLVFGAAALGDSYERGNDVAVDLTKARQLYTYAASRWSPDGQLMLGKMFQHGRGVPQDKNKAVLLFSRSAEQDNPEGKSALHEINAESL